MLGNMEMRYIIIRISMPRQVRKELQPQVRQLVDILYYTDMSRLIELGKVLIVRYLSIFLYGI